MIEYTVKVDDGGNKYWYLNGKLHNEDGPAVEHANGGKDWYLNSESMTEQEFNRRKLTASHPTLPTTYIVQTLHDGKWVAWVHADRERARHGFNFSIAESRPCRVYVTEYDTDTGEAEYFGEVTADFADELQGLS